MNQAMSQLIIEMAKVISKSSPSEETALEIAIVEAIAEEEEEDKADAKRPSH